MMRYACIFSILTSLALINASAQSLRVGYYGESVTHYGLKAGVEWKVRTYQKAGKQVEKAWLITPSLAVYRHPQNHIGLLLSSELTYRRTNRRGGILEAGISPGIFRYFLDGSTYQPDDKGELQRVRLAGGNAFMPTIFVGLGKDLSLRRQVPLTWFARLNVMQQRPYNTSALMRFSLEAGIIFPLKKQ